MLLHPPPGTPLYIHPPPGTPLYIHLAPPKTSPCLGWDPKHPRGSHRARRRGPPRPNGGLPLGWCAAVEKK